MHKPVWNCLPTPSYCPLTITPQLHRPLKTSDISHVSAWLHAPFAWNVFPAHIAQLAPFPLQLSTQMEPLQ